MDIFLKLVLYALVASALLAFICTFRIALSFTNGVCNGVADLGKS